MVDVSISLVGANNDTIQLTNSDSSFILRSGVLGFGIPPTQVRISESAGDGGVWRSTKRGIREIDLPISVLGSDRADVEAKLRRLSNLLQDTNGPTRVVATYTDGSAFQLFAHYVGGGDVAYGSDQNGIMANWTISLQAPSPYWESVNPANYLLQLSAGRGLLPQLSKLKLSGQFGFGNVTLINPGDVACFPVWELIGPCDSVAITFNGVGFQYAAPIAAGEIITIDTAAGTVKNQAGVNKYQNLAAAPKLFAIAPGTSTVSVAAPSATNATRVAGYIKPRREVVH